VQDAGEKIESGRGWRCRKSLDKSFLVGLIHLVPFVALENARAKTGDLSFAFLECNLK